MKQIMRKLGIWRLDAIPCILTIIIGLIVVPLDLFDIIGLISNDSDGIKIFMKVVLAVLSILAFALLRMGHLQEEIASGLKNLAVPPGLILRPRTDMPPLEHAIEHAKEIFIVGRTLTVVSLNHELLREKIKEGCNLRFIIVNPEIFKTHDLKHVAEADVSYIRAQSTLKIFKSLSSISNGRMEVRLIDYISDLSVRMIDSKQPGGKILVELIPYKCGIGSRMHFELTAADKDPRWYLIFRDACERMWEEATPWQG